MWINIYMGLIAGLLFSAGYVTRYDCVSQLGSQQHVAPPAAWHYHSTPPHSDDAAVAVLILTNIVHQFVIVAVKILILEEYALHFQYYTAFCWSFWNISGHITFCLSIHGKWYRIVSAFPADLCNFNLSLFQILMILCNKCHTWTFHNPYEERIRLGIYLKATDW